MPEELHTVNRDVPEAPREFGRENNCQHVVKFRADIDHPVAKATCINCGCALTISFTPTRNDHWNEGRLEATFHVTTTQIREDMQKPNMAVDAYRRMWDDSGSILPPVEYAYLLLSRDYQRRGLRYAFRFCVASGCGRTAKWKIQKATEYAGCCGLHRNVFRSKGYDVYLLSDRDYYITDGQLSENRDGVANSPVPARTEGA